MPELSAVETLPDQNALLLNAALVVCLSLGIVLLIVLTAADRRKYFFSAAIGLMTSILVAFVLNVEENPFNVLFVLAAGVVCGVVGAFILQHVLIDTLDLFKTTYLKPSLWPGASARATQISARDHARRWFVTTGATTGAMVGALITSPEFWDALSKTFRFGTLLGVLVTTIASSVLLGPMQDYVMGQDARPTPQAGKSESGFSVISFELEDMSWRHAVRLGLVGLLILAMALVFNCLQQTVEKASAYSTVHLVLIAITPAIVGYYWSAALQVTVPRSGMPSNVFKAAVTCAAIIYFVWAFLGSFLIVILLWTHGVSNEQPNAGLVIVAIFFAFWFAFVMAFLLVGFPAYAGAVALEKLTGWQAMASLAGILLAWEIVLQSSSYLIVSQILPADIAPQEMVSFGTEATFSISAAVGCIVGMVASGFPQLVNRARRPQAEQLQ